jgi:ferredoxin
MLGEENRAVATQRRELASADPERRNFLQHCLRGAFRSPAPHHPDISPERIALLREIAQRSARWLPAGAVPALHASSACVGHGVCIAACPTGALRRFEEPGARGLEFAAAACLGCGACVAVCPERALALAAGAGREASARALRIARHALRACTRCDDEFTTTGEGDLCPACRKDGALCAALFTPWSERT